MATYSPDVPYRIVGTPYASACPDVRVHVQENGVRVLELARPRTLHALTHDMVRALRGALHAFRGDSDVRLVVMCADNSATKSRAFCAGGDVVGTLLFEWRVMQCWLVIF